jgi:hypothetical protein
VSGGKVLYGPYVEGVAKKRHSQDGAGVRCYYMLGGLQVEVEGVRVYVGEEGA